ncbi:sulfatase-like hydrolase/transferase [Brucella pituitosa]|uniref:sulfatase-like hydrolase/transferase n=1 Tax=Brucella pituitosa TaxID=571256 RepID=UPI0013747861|nr:sulfatase-like hydrolase/transferase [Brucella pituitosa]
MRILWQTIKNKRYFFEANIVFLILLSTALISFSPWLYVDDYNTFIKPVVATLLLLIIVFIVISLFISRIISALFILFIIAVTRFTSDKKQLLTGEPLTFSDISQVNHLGVALKYAPYWLVMVIYLIILLFIISFIIFLITRRNNRYITIAVAIIIALGFNWQEFFRHQINPFLKRSGLNYYSWDWPQNIEVNGLLIHLLQTSSRPTPVTITDEQRIEFTNFKNAATVSKNAVQRFIMILCEACWYDENNFKDAFSPLFKRGLLDMRGISPTFGGGTPNATFEMITGLPTVNPAVAGVIYQEYSSLIGPSVSTLPSHISEAGYHTFSAHNYLPTFWQRNTVEPKLGFKAFFGLDEMVPNVDYSVFPDDRVLFQFAHERLRNAPSRSFAHLATVQTHGPYHPQNHDGGNSDYLERVSMSVDKIAQFIDEESQVTNDLVVLVYGDHKPALDMLVKSNLTDKHFRGDVPVFLFDSNKQRADILKERVSSKPFYCFPTAISEIYFDMKLPVGEYTEHPCASYDGRNYEEVSGKIPRWLYTAAVFDNR